MKSRLDPSFLECLRHVPEDIRRKARKNYQLWLQDSKHPSLGFKPISTTGIWSVRIGIGWRALGLVEANTITWFWIGSHADYDTLIRALR